MSILNLFQLLKPDYVGFFDLLVGEFAFDLEKELLLLGDLLGLLDHPLLALAHPDDAAYLLSEAGVYYAF